MKIDNYSKAIGIIYATGEILWGEEEMADTARRLQREALQLLEHTDDPQSQTITVPVARPDGKNIDFHPLSETYPNISFELCSTHSNPADYDGITTTMSAAAEPEPVSTVEESSAVHQEEPEPETITVTQQQIPQPEPKTPAANVWAHGEDSYIRVSASADEAVCNRPLDSTKTDTQVKNKWYYLKQKKMLLSKGDRIWYQGNNENLCQKFTPAGRGAILGSVSAITDDKTSAVVYFDGDHSAYTIPICDIIRAGEA